MRRRGRSARVHTNKSVGGSLGNAWGGAVAWGVALPEQDASGRKKGGLEPLRTLLARIFRHSRYRESSETFSLIASAILIGLLAGLGAVAFDRVVHLMEDGFTLLRDNFGGRNGAIVGVLIPTLGGLLVTPVVLRWAPDVRGSGIPMVMLSVSNFAGRLPKRLIFWRPLTSMVSIGTGSALGSEGPIIQFSASLASLTSGILRLSDERRRSLVAVAAASGIAATFNAPIAGVLFALEVVLGRFSNRYFSVVVIGAVAASVVSRSLLGPDPAFVVPEYGLDTPLELPLYMLLGVCSALLAVGIIRSVVAVENGFDRLSPPRWLRPTLGGFVVGLVGLLLPDVLGRGYATTGAMLSGEVIGIGFLIALAVGKVLAMATAMAAWHSGGIFAPLLFVGAAFGLAFGQFFAAIFPGLGITPGAFALVGMAAVFAGAERAPMSTIMLVFEMSGDYQLILPLLLATVVATLLGDALHPESIYQVILSRRGLSLLRLRDTDLLQSVRVGEIMRADVPKLYADDTLSTLEQALVLSHHHGFVIIRRDDPEHLFGIVTLSDVERARKEGRAGTTPLREICHRTVHCALPDEPISEVLERMAQRDIGRMPVVDTHDRRKPVGFVRQADLAKAYYQAVQRERQAEEVQEATRLRDLTGQEIVEVKIRANSPVARKTLRDLALPKESIVVAIRRGSQTIFPHGNTRLEVGDTVVANVAPGFSGTFRRYFQPRPARERS